MKELKNMLLSCEYDKAKEICKDISDAKLRDFIISLAYDTENITIYLFAIYMSVYSNKIKWLKLTVDLMINPFCFIEGAYSIALYYSREILKLEYSVENLERILFFYNIPEKLITREEAKTICDSILKINPNNKIALELTLQIMYKDVYDVLDKCFEL